MISKSPSYVGRQGEQIVYDLLPGAKWINEVNSAGKQHDIEWQGVKIDVKTSTFKVYDESFHVNLGSSAPYPNDIVYVVVGLIEGGYYLWVTRKSQVSSRIFRTKQAVKASELQKTIHVVAKATAYEPMKEGRLICRLCGYRWNPVVKEPRTCPSCKRYDWKESNEKSN